MNSDSFDGDNALHPFVVSHDLLQLFKWLFQYEEEALKKLIHKCVRNGLQESLQKKATQPEDDSELQQIVVDFLALTEILLAETVHERQIETVVHRSMIPAINHIDAAVCDKSTVAQSIAKAASTPGNHSPEELKKLLCKELLKRWKPASKILS